MDDVSEWAENDPIWAQRGKAVQGYAKLENALCTLMSVLGGMPYETSAILFYKIVSTGSRNSIIEKLLHKKHGNQFSHFWNDYLRILRSIDTKRNEIVHWMAAINVGIDEQNVIHAGVTLMPPASIPPLPPDAPCIMTQDLVDFEKKCGDFARLAVLFSTITMPASPVYAETGQTWIDIFQQPLVYPLPEGHPLNTNPPTPDNPHQSSPA